MKLIIGSTHVVFNRNRQVWQAANGRLLATHPAGNMGKLLTIIDAVTHESQELSHLCRVAALHRPDLSATIWNAARYVLNGRITVPPIRSFDTQLATVQENAHLHAHISLYDGCLLCDAPDCIHVIAYLLQVRLWQQ
jgi:hypothetical protein